MRNQNRITPAQARQLMQQRAILWDVRTPAEYAAGHRSEEHTSELQSRE